MGQEEEKVLEIAKWLASKDFPHSHWCYLSLSDKQELLDEAKAFLDGCKRGVIAYREGKRRPWGNVKVELGLA